MSERPGYWNRITISRRAALRGAAIAGGGAVAISLAGCGSGSSSNKASTPSSGGSGSSNTTQLGNLGPVTHIPSSPLDSTKGKPGGTFKAFNAGYPGAITVVDRKVNQASRQGGLVYSSLIALRWGVESVEADDISSEPDLAQALPEQPDELTYVFKIRPGVKFHNGRVVTAEDAKYSLDRYANWDKSAWRSDWQSWFDKVDATDAQTVVVKTKFPYADSVEALSGYGDGFILAKEFEEGPDINSKMVGTGPYLYVDTAPPVSMSYKRNPDYFLKPYPYFDEIIMYSTTDIAKRKADFYGKGIHMPWVVHPDEREEIKAQRPDAKFNTYLWAGSSVHMREDKTPWNDKRVRQGLSMAIDRKKIRDGTSRGEGVEDQFFSLVHQNIYGTRPVKDLGDSAKYWQYNPAEAKKLLSAAGIDKPIEADMSHWDASVVGQWFPDQATLIQAQWRELGVANMKDVPVLVAQYNQTVMQGQYDGTGLAVSSGSTANQRGLNLQRSLYWGPNGEHHPMNVGYVNDPRLSDMANKQLRQLKAEDRRATFRDMETILAEDQHRIVLSTNNQSWFWDPSVKNPWMPIGGASWSMRYAMKWWFDKA